MTNGATGVPSGRGLVDFDVGPLRRFTAIIDSMPRDPQTYGEGESARHSMRISVNCKDVEVIEAVEPYHFPIFTFQVTESNKKKSRWGVLSESFNSVADKQYSEAQLDPSSPNFIKASERMDWKDVLGKTRLGFVLADGEDGRPEPPMLYDGRAEEDKPTPAWMIYSIEGIGAAGAEGISATELAEALLDGKTLAQFNKEALANPTIRNKADLLQAISLPATAAGNFANALVTAGKFTVDDAGVYHKVAVTA
jgi:hypothetical protein